jgi:hypothetical protein
MPTWKPFTKDGITYDLSHLDSVTLTFEQPAKDDKPARLYTVNVFFGLHCFTRDPEEGEKIPSCDAYSHFGEKRMFDVDRYELSKRLPDLVKTLTTRKCFHNKDRNFFTIDIIAKNEQKLPYEVYFTLSRSSKEGVLTLRVVSAFCRTKGGHGRKQPIRFVILLFKVSNNQPVKIPPV